MGSKTNVADPRHQGALGLLTPETLQINPGMMSSNSTCSGRSQPTNQSSLSMTMEEFQKPIAHQSCEQLQFTLHLETKILVGWSKPNNQYTKRSSTTPAVIHEKMNSFDKELKKQQANVCCKLGQICTADYNNIIIYIQTRLVKIQMLKYFQQLYPVNDKPLPVNISSDYILWIFPAIISSK